ncbi:MAG: hypothetical protein WBY94_09155 [Polyangiaceae bacterium]
MRSPLRVVVAAGVHLAAATLGALAALGACSSKPVVEQAKQCLNPCCDGPASGIDCAENPNLSCVEDADPCVARTYGCNNGVLFVMGPSQVPITCSVDASDEVVPVGFVFGDN